MIVCPLLLVSMALQYTKNKALKPNLKYTLQIQFVMSCLPVSRERKYKKSYAVC